MGQSKENPNGACKKVVASKGASGVDGVTVEELGYYIGANKDMAIASLRNRTYMPKPVQNVLKAIDSILQTHFG